MSMQRLIDALPEDVAMRIAQQLITQRPELLEGAIKAAASVNYRVRVIITPEWRAAPINEAEQHFRDMLIAEIKTDIEKYERAILQSLQQFDIKRLETLSNLDPNKEVSDD